MKVRRCSVPQCTDVAWTGSLCNFHALRQARREREAEVSEGQADRARELRAWAAVLGIALDEPNDLGSPRKIRSPMS